MFAALLLSPAFAADTPTGDQTLKGPAEFASIENRTERSRAMFREIG